MRPTPTRPAFDRIARPYRWLEYLSFGPLLERCRFYRLPQLADARSALVLGDGDGRFLARLLKSNPQLRVDAVDLSPAMLQLLSNRAAEAGALDQVTLHCTDAREFIPTASYDLVVTHFFLDCFTRDELHALTGRIRSHLTPGARWVVSEFAIPPGVVSLPARFIVWILYVTFGLLTGLEVRRLPDYTAALKGAGFSLRGRRGWLRDVLVSELWESGQPTVRVAPGIHESMTSIGSSLLQPPDPCPPSSVPGFDQPYLRFEGPIPARILHRIRSPHRSPIPNHSCRRDLRPPLHPNFEIR